MDKTSTDQANSDIAQVNAANRAMLTNVRQGVQVGLFAIAAVGSGMNQTLSLLIESVFLAIEVAVAIQAGTFGIGTLLKGATVISMLYLIYQIRIQKRKNTRVTSNVVSGFRLASSR